MQVVVVGVVVVVVVVVVVFVVVGFVCCVVLCCVFVLCCVCAGKKCAARCAKIARRRILGSSKGGVCGNERDTSDPNPPHVHPKQKFCCENDSPTCKNDSLAVEPTGS